MLLSVATIFMLSYATYEYKLYTFFMYEILIYVFICMLKWFLDYDITLIIYHSAFYGSFVIEVVLCGYSASRSGFWLVYSLYGMF